MPNSSFSDLDVNELSMIFNIDEHEHAMHCKIILLTFTQFYYKTTLFFTHRKRIKY